MLAILVSMVAISANAGTHTITGGYAHSFGDDTDLNGLGIQYNYGFDNSPWGIISTVTVTGDEEHNAAGYDNGEAVKSKDTMGYASITGGASYQVADPVCLYAVAGVARGAGKSELPGDYLWDNGDDSITVRRTGFVYGAGTQFTVYKRLTFTTGVENTHFKDFGNLTTINIGAGWKF
ncbi:outer membrane beta-barrel protein [Salmonella enterica]|nr:outer membrane beta-barrel protein [Salmonella enterica]EIN8599470.1 outer membrane beta-barrel protein [Salmonella enterica subsp. enterica serovar Newport]ECM6624508.1 outer membrane beta-barrel protein [Salmonella enterica]ECP9814829.1 outer membrane beta-barrel protein [Salmonella enterica]ECX4164783.1 outer membrane beta-barrel protein [Salmonella enterica]